MKRIISAVVVLSSLVFLTACDTGVAAQIGDTKISQSLVQAKVAEILSERTKFDTSQMQISVGEELNRSELHFLVISEIFSRLAKESGIQITQAMKDSRRAQLEAQVGINNLPQAMVNAQIAPSDFDLWIQSVLISEELISRAEAAGIAKDKTGEAVKQLALALTKKVGIKVNPQYGTWDGTSGTLTAFDAAGSAVKSLNS